ncbi:hypothetical protein [Candidatus Symbiopectobacterium sp.]|uniref:GFA family protein n=1 Tax=Candidatus Symbiopectobacterium sp. TaxID=2816440 RepID=UPI0025BE41F2|nr:hypothetical protein [Candidatus Symbiopectobacterium sp.]
MATALIKIDNRLRQEDVMKMTKGQCLCGAVTVEVPEACVHEVSVCHCNMCRQWGGGPLLAVE